MVYSDSKRIKMKEQFLLDPDVIFLNHGSFGATPRPVFEAYQHWQRCLEAQPVYFFTTELPRHLQNARQALGQYLGVDGNDLVYIPNVTFGVNIVARSLHLGPGDEVLTTDHEYGACDNVWRYLSQQKGFTYQQQAIPLPISSPEAIVEQFWQGVTVNTKVIFLSHITSYTALRMPVEAICARAQATGILTVIDGAHAPGQLPLDLSVIGADFYTGNCHKWLCSPKGAAFLYTRPDKQHLIEPLVVGWGWGDERPFTFGSDYLDFHQWLGTNDLSAYLAVPTAIQFQAQHNWEQIRQQCHQLACYAYHQLNALTGLPPIYPATTDFFQQLFTAPLPSVTPHHLKTYLYGEHHIEIPIISWQNQPFMRVSVQAYNTQSEVDTLIQALSTYLKTTHSP